ncbi:nitroreductase/quinone reductase family protein [Streptomyces sp. NPDC002845]
MPNDFNQQVIDEFRAKRGQVGGYFEGARLLLLTTTGARTGTRHTTPVGYLPDGDGTVLVIASAGGAPKHPDWFRNLVANPRVTIESGAFTYEAEAEVLAGTARDQAFARAVEGDPGWAEYQAKTDRTIPVVALREIPQSGPPNINAGSMGEHIKVVHEAFRRELALIRDELAKGNSNGTLGAQLRINCLTLCQGLHNHHTGEDIAMFPFLADRHPELTPVLDRLRTEHEKIAELLEELRRTVAPKTPEVPKTPEAPEAPDSDQSADPALVLREVERLTAELEAHLAYEEEQLMPFLDAATR